MKFYSQFKQDEIIYNLFFKNKTDGFYLEIGADDGVRFSNCKFYEELGWNGIAVEPRLEKYEKLVENRNCICENVALSNIEETTDFLSIKGYGQALSGLTNKYHPKHVKRIERELKNKDNKGKEIIQVCTVKLPTILEKYNITKIDFLSIDTEGSELSILEPLDFEKYDIDVITIEDNYNDPELIKFFIERKYKFIRSIGCDKVFQKDVTSTVSMS